MVTQVKETLQKKKKKTRSSTGRSERPQAFSVCLPPPPSNKVAEHFFSPLQQGFAFLLMCFMCVSL
ncbi:hypothetical protein RchiOBHm_Chr2g0119211 [Rosa chinensis]|uniref:Uncharacterized protein n=1 Tax=Rosa chinensis TaxID=74649 RepID=A0A2P6RRZ6_ROSCH|nr:hypothetical protein RchiOBHm_Chr2g0119211 [Rosa chinensis]